MNLIERDFPGAHDPLERVKTRPRNLWTRFNVLLDLIDQGDLYRARDVLLGVRYHPALTEDVYALYENLLLEAEARSGQALKLNRPTDYLHHPSGLLRPPFRRLSANRQVPSPFPPSMVLPPLPGPRNDYRFLDDAATCLNVAYTPSVTRIHVLYTPGQATAPQTLLEGLEQQEFSGRIDLSVVGSAEATQGLGSLKLPGGGLAEVVDADILSTTARRRLTAAMEEADVVLFACGDVTLDRFALARIQHRANVSDQVVQPLIPTPSQKQFRSPFTTSELDQKLGGRYPFRNLQGLNMAVPTALLRRVGPLDTRFANSFFAAREIAYRMFNAGTYFAPVAVPALSRFKPANDQDTDEALYVDLCPNHWDRKEDGHYTTPKVSIYIPAYNASKYIERAVDSILNQDVQDLDVCIANDGSRDHTLQLLENLYSDEPRVRWVDNPNGGIGWASNQAIRMSNSLYIGQLDSDDCLKPGAVRRLMDYLDDHPEVACCYGSCERVDAAGNYLQDEYSWPVFSREKMMITSIAHHFRMFRRQAWERTSHFREDIANAVDYDIFLKLSEVGEFHHIDEKMYQRRWHGENTSNVNEGFQTSNTYRVQNETLERTGLQQAWEVHVPNPEEPRRVTYKLRDDTEMLLFWPDYSRSNPYQKLLYGKLRQKAEVVPGDIDAALQVVDKIADPGKLTFHLHWLNFLLRDITDAAEARAVAEEFMAKLKKFTWKGGRLIWTIHNHLSHDPPFPEVEVWLSSEIAKEAHVLHLHAAASAEEVAEVFDVPPEKIRVLPHGHYIGAYPDFVSRDGAREQLGIAPEDEVILFSGQVRPYKGVEQLISVFRKLLAERPRLRLLIAGEVRFDLFAAIEPELSTAERARITVTERFVDDMELQLFLRAADVAVYPYKKILTSGSLLLALSFGLPVVIPEVGMTREVLADSAAGQLYDGSEEGLEQALRQLLQKSPDALMEMGQNARHLATSQAWGDFHAVLERE